MKAALRREQRHALFPHHRDPAVFPYRSLCSAFCLSLVLLLSGCSPENEKQSTPVSGGDGATPDADAQTVAAEKPSSMYSPDAFRSAAHDGKMSVVESVLKSNMDVDEADVSGLTALAMAAYNGHTVIVKKLLAAGATVDSRDRDGKTPLIHASSGEFPETVQVLIDAGADINAIDSGEGFTPLMTAAALGNIEVVKVLLAAGADRSLVDKDDGESALVFAENAGHEEIVKLLKSE
ncbi:Ankyrin repeats (3 copies) [Stieleria varia]|uniref:Ankyrin repeats (3 copies) n=1 Tax=Stieleria varia TaxID=2528005 RepID=A0A5C6AS81_9BACT|nr:Ankyrin repeats (3 copies) [Stieleria varia]